MKVIIKLCNASVLLYFFKEFYQIIFMSMMKFSKVQNFI